MGELHEEPLNGGSALAAGGVITGIILASVLVFAGINLIRAQTVISRYNAIGKQFIEDNTDGLSRLFTEKMDLCSRDYAAALENNRNIYNISCANAIDTIDSLNKQALKDFSATAFARVQPNGVEILEASGSYQGTNLTQSNMPIKGSSDLKELLTSGKALGRWHDFLYYLPGKEVVIPVKQNGQVLGYLFLGVIER